LPDDSITHFSTPAGHLADRQRRYPPRYQTADGGKALFNRALGFSSSKIQALYARGFIAGGEVGELTPVVRAKNINPGYVVEMHSGLMRLTYSAARAIIATDSGRFRGGETSPLFSALPAAAKIAELFKNYEEREIGTAQKFPATEDQKRWANAIALHAETFLLMHELAHIHNEHPARLRSFFGAGRAETQKSEIRADATAGRWLIDYLLNNKRSGPQRQLFYAGAEFGLRIWMAMETAARMHFQSTHPAAGVRVAALRAGLRKTAGSRRYYAVAGTSLAFDQMWRAIEQLLQDRPPVFEITLEDVLSSMRTLTREWLADGDIHSPIEAVQDTDRPDRMPLTLAPRDPLKTAILASARDFMAHVNPDIRKAAQEHAGDVFERGTLEFSILLALLNSP
jgi:hypothetical protein